MSFATVIDRSGRRAAEKAVAYGVAAAFVAAALVITLGIAEFSAVYPTFFAFYAAVVAAAWYQGSGPGWLSVALSILAVNLFFLPRPNIPWPTSEHLPRVVAFAICAIFANAMSARQRRAETALREARDELEASVQQRTRELLESRDLLNRQMVARGRAVEALQLILDVTEAASAAPTATDAAAACLKKISELQDFPLGQAWFRDEESDQLVCSAKAVFAADSFPELREISLRTPLAKGKSLPGRVWEASAAIWSRIDETSIVECHVVQRRDRVGDDVPQASLTWHERELVLASPAAFPRLSTTIACGVLSAFAFPIFLGGKLLAVLEFLARDRRPLDEPFLDAVDKLGKVLGDVLARKRAEEALRASEERWRRVFESSAVPMALADGDRRIIAANAACERLLGYSSEEFLTLSALDFKYGDDRDLSKRMLSELEQGLRREFQGEMRFRQKDGTPIWVNVSVSYVPATEVTPALFPAVIEDVTQRKRAEFERQRLASVVEQANELVAIAELESRPIYLNEAGRKMIGLHELEEISSRNGEHWLFGRDREFVDSVVEPAVMTVGSWSGELRLYHLKTGEAIPVLCNAFRIDDQETGLPTSAGYICRDITERKRAEEALRASEARWRSIFEHALIGISVTGPDWRFLSANTAFLRMVGYSENELRALTPVDLTHEDDRDRTARTLRAAWTEGRTDYYSVEKRYIHKDGHVVWANVSGAPLLALGRNPAYLTATIIDITDRKRAEEALRQAQAELARVTRVTTMGELTASIAHEINQPLSAIVASGNACRRWLALAPPNLDRARDSVERMIGDANRTSDIIQRVRSLTKKSTAGQLLLNINDVIEEVLMLTRGDLVAKQVSLRTALGTDLPLIVGDKVQLQQVILNLIVNAVEAMGAVSDRRRILTINSEGSSDGGALVRVEDTGTGFDPGNTERIFNAFFTTKPDGMGMGLSISTSIVEGHGGRLWALPRTPHGAAFSFALPAAPRHRS